MYPLMLWKQVFLSFHNHITTLSLSCCSFHFHLKSLMIVPFSIWLHKSAFTIEMISYSASMISLSWAALDDYLRHPHLFVPLFLFSQNIQRRFLLAKIAVCVKMVNDEDVLSASAAMVVILRSLCTWWLHTRDVSKVSHTVHKTGEEKYRVSKQCLLDSSQNFLYLYIITLLIHAIIVTQN